MKRYAKNLADQQRHNNPAVRRVSFSTLAEKDEIAGITPAVSEVPVRGSRTAPATVERQTIQALQRSIGNSAVAERLGSQLGGTMAPKRAAVGDGPGQGQIVQRDVPPTTDPSLETPKPANLEESAKELLLKYADKYIGKLGDEAKKRLAEAWEASPGGVIAAGAVVGVGGVAYLVGAKGTLPGLPAIPLDVLGGPFVGATIELEIKGPVTNPESFGFKITFKEQGKPKKKRTSKDDPPNIYNYANPEVIAQQVDGPEFESEVPENGPDSNLRGANLANLVRIIGNGMLAGANNKETRPYVDLGEVPSTPSGFVYGLKRIVDALISAAPGTLGKIEQVNFRLYRGGKLRFIPIRPSPPQSDTEGAGTAGP